MSIKAMRFPGLMMPVLIIAFLCLLSGCGTGGLADKPASSTDGGTSTTPTATAAAVGLGTDVVTVKSDNSSTATITATVLDSSNAVIKDADVAFSATGGAISAASVKTDANGQASITFRSGTQDQSNQVVTITATASAKSAQIPIQVIGSTLTMTSLPHVNIPSDGSTTATLTVTAKNAGNNAVSNVPITLSVSGAGNVSLSTSSGITDPYTANEFRVTVTGTWAGITRVTAQGLGTSATYDYTVTGPALAVFGITAPALDPTQQVTGAPLTVTVSAPTSANVTFASSLSASAWDGGASAVIIKPVVGGVVSATIQSALAGFSTVQVYDSAVPTTTDSIGIAFYAPSTDAAQLSLQSDFSVLGLTKEGINNTTTLRANVWTSVGTGSQPVGNAPVAFSIFNPTGGGEKIEDPVAYTDSTGLATATFTSGSVSTGADGVRIDAQVLNSGPPVVTAPPISIVIGGTPGSVDVHRGSEVTVLNSTTYALPMAVLVADSDGQGVSGAKVSLSLWPTQYSSGVWYNALAYDPQNPEKVRYQPYVTGAFGNDDVNGNMRKDPTEQSDPDGALRPPNSAAGSLQSPVTTDKSGVGYFDLVYLKGSAVWITVQVRATTLVLGTETSRSITFTLPAERTEAEKGDLPNSAFPVDLTVAAIPGSVAAVPGSTVPGYTLPAFNSPYGLPAAITYATSSIYSTITAPPRGTSPVYTFTAPADVTAGKVYYDSITASDGGVTGATAAVRIVAR
ncbi:MAG: Ig-like domain-containing protein [Proteobacteria bacterium]|nr:Ig-like domain-containing protein [Pseudomonadota bacterium]MBU4583219.1 Ig-like domain-containing protein [Pseudomonadota bacterium]MCG2742112.1 Ig-like domain-containing protein [Syntrophaceae bacterium]